MVYSELSNLSGNGKISETYMQAGKTCYDAYVKARGLHDEAPWQSLVWKDQYAWCEAARAVENLNGV
jgi:hypothetical protein